MIKKIIVFGNEKGGTGKSTLAMHVVASILKDGYKVGVIDVDARQGTLSRYIENRVRTHEKRPNIPLPESCAVFRSTQKLLENAEQEEEENFMNAMHNLSDCDYVVVDTPGNDNHLSRFAHSYADILITPINESFIDLDLLVRINESLAMSELRPSTYAEMVWEQKKHKAMRNKQSIDWIVLVNRMGNVVSKNRQELERVLNALSKRIGFRLVSGFKERVIFRELFISGLTLIDDVGSVSGTSLSHIAAKRELSNLMKAINIIGHENVEEQNEVISK